MTISDLTRLLDGVKCAYPEHEPSECAYARAHLPGAAARRRAPHGVRGEAGTGYAEGVDRGRDLRHRVDHRLARRLPGSPPPAGDMAGSDPRSDRGQALD